MPPPSIAGDTAKINRILPSSSNNKQFQKPWSSVKSHWAGGPILYGFSSRNPLIFRTVASRWHPFNGFVFLENDRTHGQETFCLARTLRTMFYTFLFSSCFWRNSFCTLQVNIFSDKPWWVHIYETCLGSDDAWFSPDQLDCLLKPL